MKGYKDITKKVTTALCSKRSMYVIEFHYKGLYVGRIDVQNFIFENSIGVLGEFNQDGEFRIIKDTRLR